MDPAARPLVLDGRGIDLSRLELGHTRHVQRREGFAVKREELLREVWGYQWTGASSNVVEAVVSTLRKKMGDRAAALETVRGVATDLVRSTERTGARLLGFRTGAASAAVPAPPGQVIACTSLLIATSPRGGSRSPTRFA